MEKERKRGVYDRDLRLEACRFQGMARPFPLHFHEYYVLGLMEAGRRRLSCSGREWRLGPGSLVFFHPGEGHACTQEEGGSMDYRCFHITRERMRELAREVTGEEVLSVFSPTTAEDEDASNRFRSLHEAVMEGGDAREKEEGLRLLLARLFGRYGSLKRAALPEGGEETERACGFMREHYRERIRLEQICRQAGVSKSTLLRAFARERGITPYCYLENIRIGEAKRLLEQGATPLEAALETGFSDQSHFTNTFGRFLGLAPGRYRDMFYKKEETGGDIHGA